MMTRYDVVMWGLFKWRRQYVEVYPEYSYIVLPESQRYSLGTSGCFGWYLRLTETIGVKVLKTTFNWSLGNTNIRSRAEKEAHEEFFNMQEARRRLGDMVPEALSLQIVQIGEKEWAWGIFMEHIEGETLRHYDHLICTAIQNYVGNILQQHNISVKDNNHNNIMISNNGKLKVIDWGGGHNCKFEGLEAMRV